MQLFSLILLSLSVFSAHCAGGPRRAQWMSGRWGIGYRIQTDAPTWNTYDVQAFIQQLRTIKGNPGWIIVNLSGPAHGGDVYLSHHPLLWSLNNTDATPSPTGRDVFKELLDAIHGEGLKVIVYMAGQSPALLKLQDDVNKGDPDGLQFAHDYNYTTKRSPALERWRAYVTSAYGNPDANNWQNLKKAYVEQIVTYYANKFGSDIDGWWFDQGTFVDVPLLEAACHAANPQAVVAVNRGAKVPLQVNNAPYEDYTFGHPNPIAKTKPSDVSNIGMLTAIEGSTGGFLSKSNYDGQGNRWDVLGHMFMPMGTTWNGIDGNTIQNEWSKAQAKDWMSRALQSGGAWTWNLPRDYWYPAYNMSILRQDFVAFLNTVVDELAPSSAPSLAPTSEPSKQNSTSPSRNPSASPSQSPSINPSSFPSLRPSNYRSDMPSKAPSETPSALPSKDPTATPSTDPSMDPSSFPSKTPSTKPSLSPSRLPSADPSTDPSSFPSKTPSTKPSLSPSRDPSALPTAEPSLNPSGRPSPWSSSPSRSPSGSPSKRPTPSPTATPTTKPTLSPTTTPPPVVPTRAPTKSPTTKGPTALPTTKAPTTSPTTRFPTLSPTTKPTRIPTPSPTTKPTQSPTTKAPTSSPTTKPTSSPTTRSPTTTKPSRSPTTRTPTTSKPSRSPTTRAPTTSKPTSSPTTRAPTTTKPSSSPTTRSPTASPTTKAPAQ